MVLRTVGRSTAITIYFSTYSFEKKLNKYYFFSSSVCLPLTSVGHSLCPPFSDNQSFKSNSSSSIIVWQISPQTMAASIVNSGRAIPGSNSKFKEEIQHATVEDLKRTATLVVADETADSGVFDSAIEEKIPRFEMKEIKLGRILGRGGFCTVMEIEKVKIEGIETNSSRFRLRKRSSFGSSDRGDDLEWKSVESQSNKHFEHRDEPLSRKTLAHLSRKKSRKKRGYFAFKQVTLELASLNKVNYLKGLVDLSTEAKLLAALDHENIIRLCGVSLEGFSDFIIIERLQETLSGRLKTWMKTDRQCKGITGVFTGSKMKKVALDRDRLRTAYSIATGLDYLHSRNVIFRDLVRLSFVSCITFFAGSPYS